MPKLMGGGEEPQSCSRGWEGVKGVSHAEGKGR